MHCPKCKFHDTRVTDSRVSQDGQVIKRRRSCLSCGHRFQTIETVCVTYPSVIKRDGSEVPFFKDKIQTSIIRALSKDKNDRIGAIFTKIFDEIIMTSSEKIHSKTIGEIVMKVLKEEDAPAYMRFVSVYKNFKSTDDFKSEVMAS